MKTQIVVVGGGAGGLELVRRLGAKLGREHFDVTLVERNRTHIWKPLLHEVAAGALDANMDEVGYGSHAYRWGYRFFFGSLESIDREAQQVVIAPILDENGAELIGRHRIRYDYLVIAVGSVSNDFGTPGVSKYCLMLEDRAQADRFRLKLLDQCLRVSRALSGDPSADAYVDVAIVGGGATGVELAAELYNAASALKHYGLEVFDEKRLRVTLIEAGARILPALPEKLAEAAKEELEALGVRVLENAAVTEVTRGAMRLADGREIAGDLLVWAAGVRGPDILQNMDGLEVTRNNQLVVLPTLQTTRDARIFAIGDCCYFKPEGAETPVPPRAQTAHQMAATALDNILLLIEGKPLETFVYRDRGSLVSLSRFSTVGSLMGNLVGGRMAIEGRLARLVYLSLYNLHLIAIHGWAKGMALIAVGHANQVVRPETQVALKAVSGETGAAAGEGRMSEAFDVVIAGGAAMGSSLAYHLAADPGFGGRVLVVEKDATYARAATSLSLSSIRQQFSQPLNIRVGLAGVAFLKSAGETLAVDGDGPDLPITENGYLYLASEAGAAILRANHATQVAEGADVVLLTPEETRARFPFLDMEGVALASLGLSGEGWFDAYSLMQAFRRKAVSLGAKYRQDEVVEIEREGGRVTRVRLAGGDRIACGAFVNTAGASGAARLARALGVEIPVESRKRCVFVFDARRVSDRFPLLIDTSGVYVRPEGRHYVIGGPAPDPDPDTQDFDVDWPQFEEQLWPALAARVPAFEELKLVRAWAGHYDLNTFDHNAIVGRLPGFDNAYLAAGFSGHGVQQSPAIGRGLAELILHGGYRALDLSDFAFERIAAGRPLVERNVI